jgi:ribosomal protein S6
MFQDMRHWLFLTDSSDEELQELIDKFKNVISRTNGECLKIDKWGKRDGYKIKGLWFSLFIFGKSGCASGNR